MCILDNHSSDFITLQSRNGEAIMDILAQKLILKMRARFGDAAADVRGGELSNL
jgi:hypothetical protein